MLIDLLLFLALSYGIYLGYTQGVFRISILVISIIGILMLSMYMTGSVADFVANFFGLHFKYLPLIVFLIIVLLFTSSGIYIYNKSKNYLKNTKIAKAEKFIGAIFMAFFAVFFFAVILNFFTASMAIKKEIRENSYTYASLDIFSDSGIGLIKKLAPFVSTFIDTILVDEMSETQNKKRAESKVQKTLNENSTD